MELWEQYCLEREGLETLKTPHSFMQYRISGEECFISDAYVEPGLRKRGTLFAMAREVESIAKERGCSLLTCSVDVTACGHNQSLIAILKYGFKIHDLRITNIELYKEIDNG